MRARIWPVLLAALLVAAGLGASSALAETRIGLVIANQKYTQPGAALTNTYVDGDIVKAALEKVGFKVTVVHDTANEGALLAAIGAHVERLAKAGPDAVGFLYYSGHGAADRPDGANYLIPTEAPITHVAQLPLMAVRLDKITAALAGAGRMSFVVFDACRNVALQRDAKDFGFKGFAPIREQRGLLVAYATEAGHVAIDQSIYARALADEIVRPGLEAGQVFRAVTRHVEKATDAKQTPEFLDKRRSDFHFAPPQVAVAAPPIPAPPPPPTRPQPAVIQPPRCTGIEVDVAGAGKRCLDPADPARREFEDCFTTTKGTRVCVPMVVLPKGTYKRGSEDGVDDEKPVREVSIGYHLAVGKFEVTRGLFAAFVAATGHKTDGGCRIWTGSAWKSQPDKSWRSPGFTQDDTHPVTCLNWNDAQAFSTWLAEGTNSPYRLLTEAEWEYAARGVTRASAPHTRYHFGDDVNELCTFANGADETAKTQFNNWTVAPCNDSHVFTAPVGTKRPNAFGLYDMHGNVWEWVEDCYADNYAKAPTDGRKAPETKDCSRVLRGGSWSFNPRDLRSAFRNLLKPVNRSYIQGFRLARTLLPTP